MFRNDVKYLKKEVKKLEKQIEKKGRLDLSNKKDVLLLNEYRLARRKLRTYELK